MISDGDKLPQALLGVLARVGRLQQRKAILLAMAIQPGDVAFMNVRGIWQHDAAQIARGWCGKDVAFETAFAEMRQIAAVVDVRMREHHHIDFFRIEREVAIALHGLVAMALIKTAIQQNALSVDFDEVLGACGGASSTAEFEFHDGRWDACNRCAYWWAGTFVRANLLRRSDAFTKEDE